MAELRDFDRAVERHHAALGEIIRGNPEGFKAMYSRGDDVTLANPFGPPARGWAQVSDTLDRAAANYTWGEVLVCESVAKIVTPALAYTVELEKLTAQLAGMQETRPVSLRCTTVFRPEDGEWRIVHRHADPITSARPKESVLEE
jgi:ketosteroid isomerase-like protein